MTLDDLELPYQTLLHKWCVFWSSPQKCERRHAHTISGIDLAQGDVAQAI